MKSLEDEQIIDKELKNIEIKIAESEKINLYEIDFIFKLKNFDTHKLFYNTDLQSLSEKKE